jgi:hypothetical protein
MGHGKKVVPVRYARSELSQLLEEKDPDERRMAGFTRQQLLRTALTVAALAAIGVGAGLGVYVAVRADERESSRMAFVERCRDVGRATDTAVDGVFAGAPGGPQDHCDCGWGGTNHCRFHARRTPLR